MYQVNHNLDAVVLGSENMDGLINAIAALGDKHQDVLPISFSGDCKSNKHLYEEFNSLLFMNTVQKRLDHLEAALFKASHSKLDEQSKVQVTTVLLKWWLNIYNSVYGIVPYTRE